MAIQYYSQQATLTGMAQNFSPPGFIWSYVEVHNLGAVPYMVQFNGAMYPLPAGGRLALQQDVTPSVQPNNAITVTGTGPAFVYMTSAPPIAPVLQQNALGGGSGGVYTADGVTLQEVLNQFSIKASGVSPAELAASVAGNGLTGGAGVPLAVNVDGVTLEINADQMRVKNLGITDPKVATNAINGYHVDRAINVSPPAGQQIGSQWVGLCTPDDTFQLAVTYGLTGVTVVQDFILDPTGPLLPGQIGIATGLTPAFDIASAINAWATTLPAPLRVSGYAYNQLLYIAFHDEDAISCNSSGIAWTGATPTNCTVFRQPLGNQLPTPQPLMMYRQRITTQEAADSYTLIVPSSQEGLFTGTPIQPPIVQVWRGLFGTSYTDVTSTVGAIVTMGAAPSGFAMHVQGTFIVGDIVMCLFGSSDDGVVTPAITPRP